MGFVNLAVIIVVAIIIGGLLMQLLKGMMYFIIAILSIGIAYYLFVASPHQKAEMDKYANTVSNSIYHIDKNKLNELTNNIKNSVGKIGNVIQQKMQDLKK